LLSIITFAISILSPFEGGDAFTTIIKNTPPPKYGISSQLIINHSKSCNTNLDSLTKFFSFKLIYFSLRICVVGYVKNYHPMHSSCFRVEVRTFVDIVLGF